VDDELEPADEELEPAGEELEAPPDQSLPDGPAPARLAFLGQPGATRLLTIAVGIVAVVLVLEAAWFVVHSVRDSPVADAPAAGTIAVPSDRPVIASSVAVQEAVDEAATAAQKIVGRSYKTYDDDVAAALKLMTPDYAKEFKATTDDVRAEFIRKKTQVQARVVGQGVVRANDTEVQALVFLNEYVTRGAGKDAKTVYTQYRALLTMVHTDKGWLVDGLDTK
jgi:Mce-associated membrane protein